MYTFFNIIESTLLPTIGIEFIQFCVLITFISFAFIVENFVWD